MADANVLKNCLEERNRHLLLEHEIFFSGLRISELLEMPMQGKLDYSLLQQIHGYIFQDIYPDWAGATRSVPIYKPEKLLNNQSVEYGIPGESGKSIENDLEILFGELARDQFLSELEPETFSQKLARYLSRLWQIHPFREGNTRSIMVFFYYLSLRAGYSLSLKYLDNNHRTVRNSLVLSTTGNEVPLRRCLFRAITYSSPWNLDYLKGWILK